MHVGGLEAACGSSEAGVERLPAHADGVDLVDEDDALAAPLARESLRAAGEDADDDRVDADERGGEAGAGDRDERRVEAGRECLREHGLPGAGGAEEEQPALALAARPLERVAGLPDRDDAPNLLLRLGLAANVRELDAPLRVSRLEPLDLREVHDQERPEEDEEVHDQEERQDHEQRDDLDEERGVEEEVEREDDDGDDDRRLHPEPPEPDASSRDDVFLAQLLALEPEEARSRDQPVEEDVDDAAEAHDERERREDRPEPRPALRLVQPDDDGGGREERDRRGRTRQTAPLAGELVRELDLLETAHGLRFGRHLRSVRTPLRAEGWRWLLAFAAVSTAVMTTSEGTIELELFEGDAPKTVENFTKLAGEGYYDGLIFHRVIPDFMIQGGCPRGDGTGGPGYSFEDEFNDHPVARGYLAMANAGPNTNGSQFFIVTVEDASWLNGKHTVFGRVTSGQDVADAISFVERDGRDRPLEPVVIESIAIA